MLGKETDRGSGRLVGDKCGLTYSLFPVPPASILVCLWKYQACAWESWSSEYGLLDLRVRRDEYLPALGDEEFNPPWRL